MNRSSSFLPLMGLAVVCAISGCGPGVDGNVAARVGSADITIEDLREFTEGTPVLLQSSEEGLAAVKDYLQTMIDMELMLHDARQQGLDTGEDFVKEYAAERQTKLVQEYVTRVIAPNIEVTQDALRHAFEQSKWSRMLKLAHIQTATLTAAEAAIAELEEGRSFESVARERSINEDTAPNGGHLEWGFIGRDDLERTRIGFKIGDSLFDVPVGGLSQPYRRGDSYDVFKVLEEEEAPERYLSVFRQFFTQQKGDEAQLARVQELKQKYGVAFNPDAVAFLVELGVESGLWTTTDADKARELVAYENDTISVSDFINAYWNPVRFQHRLEFSEQGITRMVDQYLLLFRLFEKEAVVEGIDKKPAVAEWLVEKKEAMLLNLYKDHEVQAKVDSTEESIRKYYDNNTHQFMDPKTTLITEILVETKATADSLVEQIQKGADMGALAIDYTTRMFSKSQKGKIHLHTFERAVFGPLHDQAMEKAPVGELLGPLELKEGFSIFRVEERTPATPQSYERSRSRSKYWLRKREEKIHFEAMISGLRQTYASVVVVYEDNLKSMNR